MLNPVNRHQRNATYFDEAAPRPGPLPGLGETGLKARRHAYDYDEPVARDYVSPDILWLRHDALVDSDQLLPPEVIAQEIVDDLEAAPEQFRLIAADLGWQQEEAN